MENYNHEKYDEFIDNIIETRGQWTQIYDSEGNPILYENHHIIPRCLGGMPECINHTLKHENLIWLTCEEHYVAHYLLFKENPKNQKLGASWNLISNYGEYTSEDYKILREQFYSLHADFLHNWHASMTEEEKINHGKKISKGLREYWDNADEDLHYKWSDRARVQYANLSDEQKQLRIDHWRESVNNRTEEEALDVWLHKCEANKKRSQDRKNDPNYEELEILRIKRMKETKALRTEEDNKKTYNKWLKSNLKNGSFMGLKNGASKPVLCKETSMAFASVMDASRYFNINRKCIDKALKKNISDINNNHWVYITREEYVQKIQLNV